MAKPLNFPEVLNHEGKKWPKRLIDGEIRAHRRAYDLAQGVFEAFDDAGMDPWLNPDGKNNPSTADQYKLDDDYYTGKRIISLFAKVEHRPFRIATIAKVDYIGGSKENGKGISLYKGGYAEMRPALPVESPAFRFINGVLEGLEQQAVDLGVLKPEKAIATPASV